MSDPSKSKPIDIPPKSSYGGEDTTEQRSVPRQRRHSIGILRDSKWELATYPFAAPKGEYQNENPDVIITPRPQSLDSYSGWVGQPDPTDCESKKLTNVLKRVQRPKHFQNGHPRFVNAYEREVRPGSLKPWETNELAALLEAPYQKARRHQDVFQGQRRSEEWEEITAAEKWQEHLNNGVPLTDLLTKAKYETRKREITRLPGGLLGYPVKEMQKAAAEKPYSPAPLPPRRTVIPAPVQTSQLAKLDYSFHRCRPQPLLPSLPVSVCSNPFQESKYSPSVYSRPGSGLPTIIIQPPTHSPRYSSSPELAR